MTRGARGSLAADGPRTLLVVALGVAAAYRAVAVSAFPVVHDEIQVMAYGLARAFLADDILELAFRTPVSVSNGVTPLWFWVQAVPARLLGETTRIGLRSLPLLLGLWGTALCFRAARGSDGPRAAWFAGLLYAVMGLMVYVNGRGEFAESLIAPLLLGLLIDLRPGAPGAGLPVRVALWPTLLLLTYWGKGLPVWAGYALALALLHVLGRAGFVPARLPRVRRWIALTFLPLLPSLAWMLAAQSVVFGSGAPVLTDIGPVRSVWELAWKLTAGYGTAAKTFMVAGWKEALWVYTNARVWPTLALVAVPAAVAVGRLALDLVRAARRGRARELDAALVPLALILPPLATIVGKGAVGARFHLLYLAVLLPYVGGVLDRWLSLLGRGRPLAFAGWGTAGCVWFAWAASRLEAAGAGLAWDRLALLAVAGAVAVGGVAAWSRLPGGARGAGRACTAALSAGLLAVSLVWGPLDWGRRLAWEPEPNKAEGPASVDRYPNADLQLSVYFFRRETAAAEVRRGSGPGDPAGLEAPAKETMKRARRLFLRALERHPDDPGTLRVAGSALLDHGEDADRRRVLDAWRDYLRRHPDDRELAAALERAAAVRGERPGTGPLR